MRSHSFITPTCSVIALVLAALLGACGPEPDVSQLAEDRQILKNCPKNTKLATKIDLDVSGSGRTPDVGTEGLAVIQQSARQTAICGGHLLVTVFSATSAATVALYDGELELPGATDNSRLRRVQKLVDEITQKVSEVYPSAINRISPAHSDILAQFRLAAEYQEQLGARYRLRLIILTDGLQTIGIRVTKPVAVAAARALGNKVDVPRLPQASVTIAGIGKVASGGAPSSIMTAALVTYWDTVCRRSGAGQCSAVTDFTATGR